VDASPVGSVDFLTDITACDASVDVFDLDYPWGVTTDDSEGGDTGKGGWFIASGRPGFLSGLGRKIDGVRREENVEDEGRIMFVRGCSGIVGRN
jgi:hypothetical protein